MTSRPSSPTPGDISRGDSQAHKAVSEDAHSSLMVVGRDGGTPADLLEEVAGERGRTTTGEAWAAARVTGEAFPSDVEGA